MCAITVGSTVPFAAIAQSSLDKIASLEKESCALACSDATVKSVKCMMMAFKLHASLLLDSLKHYASQMDLDRSFPLKEKKNEADGTQAALGAPPPSDEFNRFPSGLRNDEEAAALFAAMERPRSKANGNHKALFNLIVLLSRWLIERHEQCILHACGSSMHLLEESFGEDPFPTMAGRQKGSLWQAA